MKKGHRSAITVGLYVCACQARAVAGSRYRPDVGWFRPDPAVLVPLVVSAAAWGVLFWLWGRTTFRLPAAPDRNVETGTSSGAAIVWCERSAVLGFCLVYVLLWGLPFMLGNRDPAGASAISQLLAVLPLPLVYLAAVPAVFGSLGPPYRRTYRFCLSRILVIYLLLWTGSLYVFVRAVAALVEGIGRGNVLTHLAAGWLGGLRLVVLLYLVSFVYLGNEGVLKSLWRAVRLLASALALSEVLRLSTVSGTLLVLNYYLQLSGAIGSYASVLVFPVLLAYLVAEILAVLKNAGEGQWLSTRPGTE